MSDNRLRAALRLAVDSGDLTPMGERVLLSVLTEHDRETAEEAWEEGREWAAGVAHAQSGESADHAADVIRDDWDENPYRAEREESRS